jgi:choloylglycine hydrolase
MLKSILFDLIPKLLNLLTVSVLVFLQMPIMLACTRAVYLGPNNMVITGRSMDWKSDMDSNLWAFPRGIKRDGAAGSNSIQWVSKYGSVGTAVWDIGIADGLNEQGLMANMLYLTQTKFPTPVPNDKRKPLALSLWVQYFLDNFATVAEAVKVMQQEPFYIVPASSPHGNPGTVHLSLSDATGDSAIFEYIDGKLNIHHSREYQVMTNDPTFEQQLALNEYWKQIGGLTMLPGTNRAVDRFVRASFYMNMIPKTDDPIESVAGVFSVMRNVSVPRGISTPERPEISTTIWRTVADQKNKRYFFEATNRPNVFWVNLSDLNLAEGAPVLKLTLTDGLVYAGNVAFQFKPTKPFQFLPSVAK